MCSARGLVRRIKSRLLSASAGDRRLAVFVRRGVEERRGRGRRQSDVGLAPPRPRPLRHRRPPTRTRPASHRHDGLPESTDTSRQRQRRVFAHRDHYRRCILDRRIAWEPANGSRRGGRLIDNVLHALWPTIVLLWIIQSRVVQIHTERGC